MKHFHCILIYCLQEPCYVAKISWTNIRTKKFIFPFKPQLFLQQHPIYKWKFLFPMRDISSLPVENTCCFFGCLPSYIFFFLLVNANLVFWENHTFYTLSSCASIGVDSIPMDTWLRLANQNWHSSGMWPNIDQCKSGSELSLCWGKYKKLYCG